MARRIFTLVGFLAILGIGGYFYTMMKPHRDVSNEKAIPVTAVALFKAYSFDEPQANAKYLDKAVAVTGTVGEVSTNQEGFKVIVLKTEDAFFGVSCTMKDLTVEASNGEEVTIKGFCRGYLSDVVLNECELIK